MGDGGGGGGEGPRGGDVLLLLLGCHRERLILLEVTDSDRVGEKKNMSPVVERSFSLF